MTLHQCFVFHFSDFQIHTCRQVVKKMSEAELTEDQADSPCRKGLVTLASSKKGKVPHNRVVSARPKSKPVLQNSNLKASAPQTQLQVRSL